MNSKELASIIHAADFRYPITQDNCKEKFAKLSKSTKKAYISMASCYLSSRKKYFIKDKRGLNHLDYFGENGWASSLKDVEPFYSKHVALAHLAILRKDDPYAKFRLFSIKQKS